MTDELEQLLRRSDPIQQDSAQLDAAARSAMGRAARRRRPWRRARLVATTTVALLVVGGGAAFASPAVRSIFDPDVTRVTLHVETSGSTRARCTSTVVTSIKLGDVDAHRATIRAFKRWAGDHPLTVRVPRDADRLAVLIELGHAQDEWLRRFDRDRSGVTLLAAADVFTKTHCTRTGRR